MTHATDLTLDPPTTLGRTLRFLGPGLIVAGAIVGSGELIATTKTGAQAGIDLLWLIVVGCVIKVFVQVELGRYAVTFGETTLTALNSLPGPKLLRVHPVIWCWLAMMVAAVMQLGGIIGGVGQAMAIAVPLTGDFAAEIAIPAEDDLATYQLWSDRLESDTFAELAVDERERVAATVARVSAALERAGERAAPAMAAVDAGQPIPARFTLDDKYWATLFALLTMGFLFNGRYGVVQAIATTLVFAFTLATIVNVVGLQTNPDWALGAGDLLRGLSLRLPGGDDRGAAIATALATFGIIGVGATELISYPYWCLEKGYARYTGPRSEDDDWLARARGWLRVLRYDAFASMVVYTVATIAFFLTGVAVLHRSGLDPEGIRMVSTLGEAYRPVFGQTASQLFLIGAVAVLYSTFLVAIASQSRIYTDALGIFGLLDTTDPRLVGRGVRAFGVLMPAGCLLMCWAGLDPVYAVLVSGFMQALMLPILGVAALYFRFARIDRRLAPGRLWDALLVVSAIGLLISGGWTAYSAYQKTTATVEETAAVRLDLPGEPYQPVSLRTGRVSSDAAAEATLLPSNSTACTSSTIGISMPRRRLIAKIDAVVGTPSLTDPPIESRI